MSRFKNALCLLAIPEDWSGCGLSIRHCCCQRLNGHAGPHRSWSREWEGGDQESRVRSKE